MISNTTLKLKAFAAAGALVIAFVGAAQAATLNVIAHSTQGPGNMAHVFAPNYTANTPMGATWLVDPTVDNSPLTVLRDYKSPFKNTPLEAGQTYFAADTRDASNDNGVTTSAELTFSTRQTSFDMLWGSVDGGNKISFFSGLAPVFTYTGAELAALLGLPLPFAGVNGSYEEVVLLSFGGFGLSGFDRITFASNRPAFEFALPAPIPVPAAGLLLLSALGGVALLRRRKAV